MKTNIIKACAIGLSVFAFAITVSASTTWTPPAGAPPGSNVDAPVNVGYGMQAKPGWLSAGRLFAGYFGPTGCLSTNNCVSSEPNTTDTTLDVNGVSSTNGLGVFGASGLYGHTFIGQFLATYSQIPINNNSQQSGMLIPKDPISKVLGFLFGGAETALAQQTNTYVPNTNVAALSVAAQTYGGPFSPILQVDGDSQLNGALQVGGGIDAAGVYSRGGIASAGTIYSTGDIWANKDLTVAKNQTLEGNLNVGGVSSFAGSAYFDSKADVTLSELRGGVAPSANGSSINTVCADQYGKLILCSPAVPPTGNQMFTGPGTFTFTVPQRNNNQADINRISVMLSGCGGGGGTKSTGVAGGGGGGGADVRSWFNVSPGDTFTMTLCAGGAVGNDNINNGKGGDGGNSTFGTYANPNILVAHGGTGGYSGDPANNVLSDRGGNGGDAVGGNIHNIPGYAGHVYNGGGGMDGAGPGGNGGHGNVLPQAGVTGSSYIIW